jgi:hypothetical protein
MADSSRSPETGDDARRGPGRAAPGSRPRWAVILVVAAAIALVGLMVFLHLTGTLGPGVH